MLLNYGQWKIRVGVLKIHGVGSHIHAKVHAGDTGEGRDVLLLLLRVLLHVEGALSDACLIWTLERVV